MTLSAAANSITVLRCWHVRDEGIPGMRSDSFEWVCNKLRVRTYQGLTETFGFPVVAKLKKKKRKKKDEPPQLRTQNDRW